MSPPAVRPRINPPQQRDLSKNSAASEGRTGSKYLRTKSSSRRPVEILDDDDEFFPTRKAKRSSSQPTKKTTIEVQIPPYRQVGSAIGYQGSSNKETSLPKHKIWGNDDSKAPAEVSGYQGTANKVPTLSKNKMRGKSDSQPSAEISGYQSTSNQEPSRPRNKIWGNGDSQPPAEVSGYQGTSSREPSLPKNRLWGNSDPQPPEEASGYQGTTKKEFSRPKIRTGTSGNSQPPAEPTRFEKYFPLAQNRTPTDNPNGTYSAHPLRGGDQKMANSGLGTEIRSSVTCSSVSGANDEDSVEEEIVTAAAQATLNNIRPIRTVPRPNILYEGHREPADGESSDEESEELESEESEASNVEPKDSKPRHAGFPPVEELPDWFPENIKQMYQVDRHGGALSYRELDEITRYRAALEIIYRRKWRKYIQAGRARWQLQQALHHLKCRPLTKPFYKYRKEQFRTWKANGLRLWKRLEKTHRGILILEETIDINFRQERIIYEEKLGGGHM